MLHNGNARQQAGRASTVVCAHGALRSFHSADCVLCVAGARSPAGLTKVPIDGQPISIVQDLEDMCKQYVKVRHAAAPAAAQEYPHLEQGQD